MSSDQRQNVTIYLIQKALENWGLSAKDYNRLLEYIEANHKSMLALGRLVKNPNNLFDQNIRMEAANEIRIKAIKVFLGWEGNAEGDQKQLDDSYLLMAILVNGLRSPSHLKIPDEDREGTNLT
jgi:hypothetical protein